MLCFSNAIVLGISFMFLNIVNEIRDFVFHIVCQEANF